VPESVPGEADGNGAAERIGAACEGLPVEIVETVGDIALGRRPEKRKEPALVRWLPSMSLLPRRDW
jgi:hypothetical protein